MGNASYGVFVRSIWAEKTPPLPLQYMLHHIPKGVERQVSYNSF